MERKGLIAWFARNHVAANLLMLVVMMGGLLSITLINKEIFPVIALNKITITTYYSGAAPNEIEQTVNAKIEQAVDGIALIKRVTSTAYEGYGIVTIELQRDAEFSEVFDKVKQSVDGISTFPENMEKPLIKRMKFTSNVMYLALYGDLTDKQLKEYAKAIKKEILQQTSATNLIITGVKDYEISIEITELTLRQYGLTFEDVAKVIRQRSIDLPAGSIKAEDGDLRLSIKGQLYKGSQFQHIVLKTKPDGSRLLLSDVATIHDGFNDDSVLNRFNRKRAVVIQIRNLPDEDATKIAAQVNQYIEHKKAQLPQGVYLDKWGDMTHYLEGRLNMMLSNMVYGGILVFAILALFLEMKVAFWVILGIPFSFLGALLLMPVDGIGVSINLISLFGFILVLGIVVDDAIVIGESVYSEISRKGQSLNNVIDGAKRVALPATFGVLTTMVAFAPMLLSDTPRTAFFKAIGWVVVLCLAFSLIESKLILPAHLARTKLANKDKKSNWLINIKRKFNKNVDVFIDVYYRQFINLCLRQRYSVLAFFIGVLIFALSIVFSGQLRWVYFPSLPSDYIQVNVEMNQSHSDKNNMKVITQIEQALYDTDDAIYQELGFNVVKHSFINRKNNRNLVIVVELEKSEYMPISSFDILDKWKAMLPPLVGVKKLSFKASINRTNSDIQYSLQGDDFGKLKKAANQLKRILNRYDGTYNVSDDLAARVQEIKLQLKPAGEALGISLSRLAYQVRNAFHGVEVQRILRDKEEIKVMVRYPVSERGTLSYVEDMRIQLPNGKFVPFAAIAEAKLAPSLSTINRVDGQRSVIVTADVYKELTSPSDIYDDIKLKQLAELKKQFPSVKIQLDGEAKEEQQTTGSLIRDAALALFVIYALMAIPLKSYTQPLIIMSVIPFGIIGAIAGHYFVGITLNLLSVFGILALAGVVVNDSLVLVVFVNRAVANKESILQAVSNAGCYRFRAIVLTSLTTFFGLAPILLETSLQAQIVIPMATSLAFGILFATVVTLILVPALYLILEDIDQLRKRFLVWWWKPESK